MITERITITWLTRGKGKWTASVRVTMSNGRQRVVQSMTVPGLVGNGLHTAILGAMNRDPNWTKQRAYLERTEVPHGV